MNQSIHSKLGYDSHSTLYFSDQLYDFCTLYSLCGFNIYETRLFSLHLKFTIAGENADPFGVIVGNDNVTIGVNGDASGPLELPWRPTPYPKTTLKLSIIRKYL